MAKAKPVEVHEDDLVEVKLPSGASFWVYGREVSYFQERSQRYLQDNKLSNISDLASLDQILMVELLIWRYSVWLSLQKDYWGDPVDEPSLNKLIKDSSAELRQIKSSLGIDKVTRDRQKGDESFSAWFEKARERAKMFGIMRENQLAKALELFNELKAKIILCENTTDKEKAILTNEMPITRDQIYEWIRDSAIPEYDQIDEHFRTHEQKFWIREM